MNNYGIRAWSSWVLRWPNRNEERPVIAWEFVGSWHGDGSATKCWPWIIDAGQPTQFRMPMVDVMTKDYWVLVPPSVELSETHDP